MKKSGIILIAAMLLFASCGMENLEKDKKMKENSGLNKENEQYEKNVENSIYSEGNNFRTKRVIEKLKAGETVFVAAIGGSVTEGAGPKDENGKELWQLGYAFKFKEALEERYPDANIVFDGAGLSGSPSALGVIRYEKDVVKILGQTPDVLVIEYSVNDGEECTKTRGFERIIRNVLEEKSDAMVISLYAHATYQNTQDSMMPVASFYEIPQVSIRNALENPEANVDLSQGGEFFDDYVHPTAEGHVFMADCLMRIFEKAEEAQEDKVGSVPDSYKNDKAFENFHSVYSDTEDSNVTITAGAFNSKDGNTQSIKKGGTEFPENWHFNGKGDSSESFKAELECRSLLFAYKHQGSWLSDKFGNADVYVDGKKFATYDGHNDGKGWNDCVTVMLIDETVSKKHTVEVKMSEGSENLGFTILCMGYSK